MQTCPASGVAALPQGGRICGTVTSDTRTGDTIAPPQPAPPEADRGRPLRADGATSPEAGVQTEPNCSPARFPFRVIFVNRFFYPDHSATGQLLSDLAFELASRGVSVHVVSCRFAYEDPSCRFARRQLSSGVDIHRVWTTKFGRASSFGRAIDYSTFYIAAFIRLYHLLQKGDVVVAKTDPPLVSVVCALVAWYKGARLVNWLQDLFPEVAFALKVRGLGQPLRRLLKTARNRSLRFADRNVVIGERMAELVRSILPNEAGVRVINNWAKGTAITPIAREVNTLRQEWNLGDRFVVGYSGNMGRAHEFETLLDAMTELRHDASIAFLFVGGGGQAEALKRACRDRQITNVVFRPYQPRERLAESLGIADAHIVSLQPALEGLIVPSKFYGIAAAARPAIVIGDPDGEIGGIVSSSGCGVCIRPGDCRGLVQLLRDWSRDPEEPNRMGKRAREVFEGRYEFSHALASWMELLSEINAGVPFTGESQLRSAKTAR